jgi:hypothetical protein
MKSWPGSALIFTPSANPVHWARLRAIGAVASAATARLADARGSIS